MTARPMFPLGSVLFPSLVLPLHVFEPRYRALVADCLEGDREFGVVLIERGSEVGGGDVRTDVGTIARILETEATEDGRYAVIAVGTERLRVRRWLDDDPYPRADVERWPDPATDGGPTPDELAELAALLRRCLALAAELGEASAPLDVELSEDPALATFQVAALAPIGPADAQAVLATEGPAERARRLTATLSDAADLLRARLGG